MIGCNDPWGAETTFHSNSLICFGGINEKLPPYFSLTLLLLFPGKGVAGVTFGHLQKSSQKSTVKRQEGVKAFPWRLAGEGTNL